MKQGAVISFRLVQNRIIWCFIFVRFGTLRRCIEKRWKKCVSQASKIRRNLRTIEWLFIVRFSWDIIPIFAVSQSNWKTCQLPSMYPPCGWSTLLSVLFHQGLGWRLLFRSPFKINKVYISAQYSHKWLPICKSRFWLPPCCPRLGSLDHPVCHILLNVLVFTAYCVYQTLPITIQRLSTVLFHHSLILWICRRRWTQPHPQKMPVVEWMESRNCSVYKF